MSSFNEGKSAASFCLQVAAWFPDPFCNFYIVKNHEIAKNSSTIKVREKCNNRFGFPQNFRNFLMYV
jgi:hypothetical protein